MTYGEFFLYFSAGAFWGVMICVNGKSMYRRYRAKRGMSNLNDMIARMKKEAEEAIRNSQKNDTETHFLRWRHKGQMQEVKIIIDPSLDNISSEVDIKDAVLRGEAGQLAALMDGDVSQEIKDKMASQEAFVFSRRSVENMRIAGLSPDEVVTKILKAAGRMD